LEENIQKPEKGRDRDRNADYEKRKTRGVFPRRPIYVTQLAPRFFEIIYESLENAHFCDF